MPGPHARLPCLVRGPRPSCKRPPSPREQPPAGVECSQYSCKTPWAGTGSHRDPCASSLPSCETLVRDPCGKDPLQIPSVTVRKPAVPEQDPWTPSWPPCEPPNPHASPPTPTQSPHTPMQAPRARGPLQIPSRPAQEPTVPVRDPWADTEPYRPSSCQAPGPCARPSCETLVRDTHCKSPPEPQRCLQSPCKTPGTPM